MKNLGTLRLNKKTRTWIMKCEPHVAMMAKRVFGKMPKVGSTFKVKHDPGNCYELRWFLQRYPLNVSHRKDLEAGADKYQEKINFLSTIIDRKYEAHEYKLAIEAREYQKKAAELWNKVFNYLLADDVGLGKTAMILGETVLQPGEAMQAAGEFDALMRQATGLAKAPYVATFVEMLLEQGTPVVLFGWHHAVYEVWLKQLEKWKPVLYTGHQSAKQKQEAVDAFVSGESNLIIISLRSGAGLDGLQKRCCTTVHGELDWSPGIIEQNIGRVDRDGQAQPVTAFILVSDEGSDPLMVEVIGLKTDQIEGIRGRSSVLQRNDGGHTLKRLAAEYLKKVDLKPAEDVQEFSESA